MKKYYNQHGNDANERIPRSLPLTTRNWPWRYLRHLTSVKNIVTTRKVGINKCIFFKMKHLNCSAAITSNKNFVCCLFLYFVIINFSVCVVFLTGFPVHVGCSCYDLDTRWNVLLLLCSQVATELYFSKVCYLPLSTNMETI